MLSCTLLRHLLKPAALLQMNEDSLAALSHFLKASCEIGQEAGGVEVRTDNFAILLLAMLSFADSLYLQDSVV